MFDVLLISFGILVIYWFLIATRHPKNFPPGPRWSLPVLGNALDIGTDMGVGFENLRLKYGDVFGMFLSKDRAVVVSDYNLIQEVGSNPAFVNRQDFRAAQDLRGGMVKSGNEETIGGVIFSNGPTWVEQRRYALHTLRNLGFGKQGMEGLIREEVLELCKHLEKNNSQPINIRTDFNLAVLNSLWTLVLNDRLSYDNEKLQTLLRLLDQTFQESTNPINLLLFMYRPLAWFAEKTNIISGPVAMHKIMGLVEGGVREHEESFQEDSLRDFTDHFLKEIKDKSNSSEESSFKGADGRLNLVNVLIDFFIAGSETTSTTLNWAMLFMIQYPDIQDKVRKELEAVTGGSRMPTMSDRLDTPFTEAVIHEVQRLGNILPFSVTHTAATDAYLGKHFIPKGTNIFPNLGRVMKDPNNFPQPSKFDPTRYIKDGKFEPHPMVVPFGLGRRRCLGETLARMTLYLFFTGIVSRFDLTKENEGDVLNEEGKFGGTNSPHPYKMRFLPRK